MPIPRPCGRLSLREATIRRLWQNVDSIVHVPKATGSFLSHLRIWEEVSRSNQPGGLVVEDDCMPIYHPFFAIEPLIDSDVGLVFLNDRIATNQPLGNYESFVQQSSRSLFAARPRTIGSDCYYISKALATHILKGLEAKGLPTEVDLFLLRDASPAGWTEPISIDPAPGGTRRRAISVRVIVSMDKPIAWAFRTRNTRSPGDHRSDPGRDLTVRTAVDVD